MVDQDKRVNMNPEAWKQNFRQLTQRVGIKDDLSDALLLVLRQCYTNPLTFLGPPKNLPEDLLPLSRPLTVSKESWKARRLNHLASRTCQRCGKKGHSEVNCTQRIVCRRCGESGHPTTACKVPNPKANRMDQDDGDQKAKDSPNRGKRNNKGKGAKRGKK